MLMAMNTIGRRIVYLRKKVLGITQQEFGAPIGVTRGAVGNWERGEGITRDHLEAISVEYPMAPFEWLATGKGKAPPPAARESSGRLRQDALTISSVGGAKGIPEDATAEIDVTAGLGGGGLTVITERAVGRMRYAAEEVRDYWRLPEWLLRTWNVATPQEIAAFPAQGDSMSPTILNGDIIFADLRHKVPSPPGIYVLADAFGGVVAKRVEVVSRPDEDPVRVKISSDNPKHESAVWTLPEIHIIGRYVGRFTQFTGFLTALV